jgi:hypothetical protein
MRLGVELVLGSLWFTSRKNKMIQVIWNLRSHKACFQVYVIHCHGLMGFAMGEAKEVYLLQMSRDHGIEMLFYYFLINLKNKQYRQTFFKVMRKDGKKVPKTALFGHILKKINTSTFWCMVNSLGPHSVFA